MGRFDAVIFDMDGVLIDSEPLHHDVVNRVLATDGVPSLERSEYEQFLGTTTDDFFDTLIVRYHLGRSKAEYTTHYDDALLLVLAEPREPSPGVKALIARLRTLGLRIALASSSRRIWIDATLRSVGLSDAFDALVSGDDVEFGKPDPAIYLLAAQRIGVEPARCLAIEDSPSGVQSARAAGMLVLGVRTPYTAHLRLDGVQRTVDSLAELDLTGDDVFA
jgi:beta-phosphoglucomutase